MKLQTLEERTINEEITVDEVAALAIKGTEEEVDSTTPKNNTTSKISALPSFNCKRIFSDTRDSSLSYTPSRTSTPYCQTSESKRKCSKESCSKDSRVWRAMDKANKNLYYHNSDNVAICCTKKIEEDHLKEVQEK